MDCLCVNDAHIFLHMLKIQICSYSELKQFIWKTWMYMPSDLMLNLSVKAKKNLVSRKRSLLKLSTALQLHQQNELLQRYSLSLSLSPSKLLFLYMSLNRVLPGSMKSLAKWLLKLICKFFSFKSSSVCNRFNSCLTCWNYNRGRRSWYWGHFPSTYQKT